MASSTVTNAYLVDFESVLNIPDNEGMQNMFKALESSGLRGFLGCKSVLFAGVFELPTEGLSNFYDVPKNLVYDARKIFSKSGVPVVPHGKKKLLKYEYRLLNDILAKSITVKAGSFDAVTTERFQMMTAIRFGLKINWCKVLFGVFEEMVDRTVKKAKGYGAQISVLLNSVPALTMGEATPFSSSKIFSPNTVITYITTNQTADTRGQSDEGGKTPVSIVKRASKSKKKSEPTSDAPVEIVSKVGKASASTANMDMASVAQDAVRLQVIEPTPAVTTAQPPAPKRKLPKRNLILSEGSNDDYVEENIDVASVKVVGVNVEESIENVGHVSAEHILTETDVGDIAFGDSTADNPEELAQWLENYISEGAGQNLAQAVGSKQVAEELMSIDGLLLQIPDDMLLPSVSAVEITKIRLGESISINEVQERDLYYASLPRISALDKGKEILEEDEPVKGNPARETVELICGDVEFLVQLRDRVMKDVVEFFQSFSLNKLTNLDGLLELKGKEKLMLEWAETDSLETAVKRKMYILAKYREMLLRKFLDSHRKFLIPGQPWTTTASQIIDLLTVAHSKSLEALVAQQNEHGLPIEQPCTSTFLDTSIGSGAVLAQFFSQAKSKCWVWPMVLIDGVWTPIQGNDFLRSSCKLSLFVKKKKLPETVVEDTFVPHVLFIEPVQYWGAAPTLIKTWGWNRVCTDIVRYHMFGCLRPVSEDVCTDIVVYNLGIERIPTSFRNIFARGILTESFVGYFHDSDVQNLSDFEESSSDGSTVYRSPSPLHDESLELGPGIPTVAQEEQLYFVQSPESPPATSPCLETSTSSTSLSMHFDADDIPLVDTADIQTSLPIGRTEFVEAIDDLRAFLLKHIDDSNSEILSKLHTLERGLRDTLHDQDANARKLINSVCQDAHTISDVQKLHLNEDDSDVQNLSDFEESSSDGSTVYRSPSPLRDESLALGPGIPTVAQEEQLYFVQSPESPLATFSCLETSTSSTSLSMHFDADDIPLDDTADIQTSLPVGRTEFVEAIDDLQAFILQRIDDSNSEILSKLHTLERGLRDTLHDQDANARKLINSVCQDAHTMSDVQKIHLNDVKKVVLAQGVTAGADSLEIRKEFKALDAKINSLDGQVAAIRNEQLEFQTKIAADILSLSTHLGDIVDYIRGGDAKKGEGSSSRRPLPTPVHQKVKELVMLFGNSKFNGTSFAVNRYEHSRNIRYHDVTIRFSYNGRITDMMTSATVE
ncbi:hypothetical protein F511_09293 [Dorcoceras hygrometricum]|uniref:Uncharacterized protein n=1 Tax=Dorcoceras hygrometricum TaxID=472368 RepID=A0A2Z7AP52_9LAMI|nr:hypothetical protein F511_09293 [Dorcoceras hygrometricum]